MKRRILQQRYKTSMFCIRSRSAHFTEVSPLPVTFMFEADGYCTETVILTCHIYCDNGQWLSRSEFEHHIFRIQGNKFNQM